MLRLKNITAGYDGDDIVSGFSLSVEDGETVCLYGPSGMGKTTVLMAAAGLLSPVHGQIENTFKRISFVFQDERLLPWLSAADNIVFALSSCYGKKDAESIARHWLEKLELTDAAGKLPGELSGGMKRRVNIARALAVNPDFLLMDEAFSFLDSELAQRCAEEIMKWKKESCGTILAVSHDSRLMTALTPRNIYLNQYESCFPRLRRSREMQDSLAGDSAE